MTDKEMTNEEMADKHAEEYCRQDDLGHFIRTTEEVKQAYIDGFLAGLKEGKPKWHKVADGDLPKDEFQKGAEYGYNKANEWHYVKNGDFPKEDENFICMLENGYKLECYYDPTTKRWYDNFFHHDIEYGYYQSNVIAWKEIVLPEPSKYWDLSTGENNINKESE